MTQEFGRRERRLQARRLLTDADEKPRTSSDIGSIGRFFDKNYHKLQIIPILILLLSISYLVWFTNDTGDFVKRGVSLAGGTSVTVTTTQEFNQRSLEESLGAAFPDADIAIRVLGSSGSRTGFTVDVAGLGDRGDIELVAFLRTTYPAASFSVETTGSSLGDSFFKQTLIAILIAFVLMGIVVFISFRTFYPSIAVILAGASTVLSTLAVFNLLGMALSTAGVAAFLMLIGYSIDTDILLSSRVLKRDGHFISNVWSAAKTGLTMQFTTAFAVTIVLVFSNNPVFNQIMTIILIGMFFDVIYTWIQNAAILKWYFERKERGSS